MPARHPAHKPANKPAQKSARYRGRHRGRSNTTRALAVGGTGVGALAVSVIAPTAAHATTTAQWDRVAQCESGGNWSADTGNGYYGGLQFAASTWNGFGGDKYAQLASDASKQQQITIADKVLAAQGWGAWPVCSQQAGVANTPTTQPSSESGAQARTAHRRNFVVYGWGVDWEYHAGEHTGSNTGIYRVHKGDTLNSIATAHHEGWHHLYKVNRDVIGPHPKHLHVGEELRVKLPKNH